MPPERRSVPGQVVFSCAPGWLCCVQAGDTAGTASIQVAPCPPASESPTSLVVHATDADGQLSPLGGGYVRSVRTGRRGAYVALIDCPPHGAPRVRVGTLSPSPDASAWAWRDAATATLPEHAQHCRLSGQLLDGPIAVISATGNDDDALFSLAVLAPPVAEQSTCLVARAVMEPPVAAAWRLGVLRFGKQRPAPRLLCSGWDLFADAPGPAALLVIPPNPGRIGWSFAAVPLTDAFSAEATQLGDAADSPASLMAHYAALGAHVLPHELAETTPTRDSLRAWLLRAAAPPRAWCWLASASSQAIRLGHSRRPPWACDDAHTLTLVHTRTMGQAALSLGATHAVPMALPPAGCAASLAILSRASSADAMVPMDVDAPAALIGACTHSGTVLGCTLHMLDTAKAAAALDQGALSVSDSPAMSALADAVALRAAAAATETRYDEHKLHLKLGLAQTARDALRACATRPAAGLPAAQVHGCFCGGEYVVTAALEGGCTMESASLLLLCDAGATVAVGRATHTQRSAVPQSSSTQLTCAVPAAAVAAQPRGSALHVVLTGRMEGDAPDAPPVFHHLGRLVPDWSAPHGHVAAGVPHSMDIARHVHLRSPPGGSDLRQLVRLLRAALRLEVHDARDSSHALVLKVPPGHELLPPGSHVTVCSLTAQRGEVALAARLACEVDVLQAAVAACLPPDVVLSSAVGSDAALRDARSLADAILQELRCDDAERLLQVQARTDAACARVVQALCLA